MNLIDNIPTSDNLIFSLIRQIALLENKPKKQNEDNIGREFLMIALIASLFLVVASEAYKVVLRKNIGRYALSMPGVVTSSLMFLIWACIIGLVLYGTNFDGNTTDDYSVYGQFFFNKYILLSAVICYIAFGIYVFIRGLDEYYRSEADTNNDPQHVLYRGDCIFFTHLTVTGIDQAKIWSSHEPKTCLKYGVILTMIHPLIGLPLFFAAISFWVNEWYHVQFKWQRLKKKQDEMIFQAQMANFTQNQNSQIMPSNEGAQ